MQITRIAFLLDFVHRLMSLKKQKSNLSKKKREHLQTLLYRFENLVQQWSNIKFCRFLIASHNKVYIHINNLSEWNIIRHVTMRMEPNLDESQVPCGVAYYNVKNRDRDNQSTKATWNTLHGPSGNFRRNCLCILAEETTHPELIMCTN